MPIHDRFLFVRSGYSRDDFQANVLNFQSAFQAIFQPQDVVLYGMRIPIGRCPDLIFIRAGYG
jgi:hypothetical protein